MTNDDTELLSEIEDVLSGESVRSGILTSWVQTFGIRATLEDLVAACHKMKLAKPRAVLKSAIMYLDENGYD